MELSEFDSNNQSRFVKYINESLQEEKALALISRKLQDAGLSHESSKKLIQERALALASQAKREGLIRLALGAGAMIVLFLVGYQSSGRRNYYLMSAGALIGGVYLFLKSRKRLNYLNRIFNS